MLSPVKLSAIDLNLLLALHAVLEEQSVAQAAQRLHVTPSAVSNALARLRTLLGDPLFVRKGRGLTPTPRALELAPRLKAALGGLESALDEGERFDPATTQRRFSLTLGDGDQVALLPKVAAAFTKHFPRASLEILSIDALVSAGGLAAPVADALVGFALREPDLHSAPLFEEQAVMLVRRDHPRVRRKLTAALFSSERHVDTHLALGKPGIGHRAAEQVFSRAGLTRNVAVVVPSFTAAALVAAQTDLIASMPRGVAESFARLGELRVLEAPVALRFTLSLVWHERTQRDPGAMAFRALLLATCQRASARKRRV